VPLIDQKLVYCSIFLYPTVEDAKARRGWGGSGFLLGVRSEAHPALVHLYGVTNDHVRVGNPVFRYQDHDPEPGEPDDWVPHPEGDDVAVKRLGLVPERQCNYVDRELILDWGTALTTRLGPGDDCLMVGRYIAPDLEQRKQPVVRFGNLSTWQPELIWQPKRAFNQESFLVDMRSLAGFSGSPVIVYWVKGGVMSLTTTPRPDTVVGERSLMDRKWLLGVDWGHTPLTLPVLDRDGEQVDEEWQLTVNTGMAAVVPAWKLNAILDSDDFVTSRKAGDEEVASKAGGPWP
jgi:hypothetical protein